MGKFNFKNPPKKAVQKQIPKSGVTPARIVRIVEYGKQESEYKGELKVQPKVGITFETVKQKGDFDGEKKPFIVSKEFTLSAHEKSGLVGFFNSIDVEVETFDDLLGQAVLLNVKHYKAKNGITYAQFNGALPPMDEDTPEAYNELLYFSFDEPTQSTWNKLYDWEKSKIQQAVDYDPSKFKFNEEEDEDEYLEDEGTEEQAWD